MQPFGRNGYGPKIGGLCPVRGGGARSPSNTIWPRPKPTCVPSFILIRQTVWPHYTNVTDRQDRTDRQRSDSIGRTVLQTVAQKFSRGSMLVIVCGCRHVYDSNPSAHPTSKTSIRPGIKPSGFLCFIMKFIDGVF